MYKSRLWLSTELEEDKSEMIVVKLNEKDLASIRLLHSPPPHPHFGFVCTIRKWPSLEGGFELLTWDWIPVLIAMVL